MCILIMIEKKNVEFSIYTKHHLIMKYITLISKLKKTRLKKLQIDKHNSKT